MADDQDKIVLRWKEAATTNIRYGRAVLTVRKSVRLRKLPTSERQRKEITDEDLAWAFVKSQVVSHTASFDWEKADLARLLPRVSGAITEPKISVGSPADLLPELERLQADELERWKQLSEQIKGQLLPSVGGRLSKDLAELRNMPTLSGSVRKMMKDTADQIASSRRLDTSAFRPQILDTLEDIDQLKGTFFRSVMVNPVTDLGEIGFDQTAFAELRTFSEPIDFGGPLEGLANWDDLIKRAAAAARETEDSSALVELVESTEAEAAKPVDEIDIDRLGAEFGKLIEQIKQLADANDNVMLKAIIATVIGGLILYFIQYVLAVKCGITLSPPEAPK